MWVLKSYDVLHAKIKKILRVVLESNGHYSSAENAIICVTSEIATNASKSEWSAESRIWCATKGWQRQTPDSHPLLAIKIRTDASDYRYLNLPDPNLRSNRASQVLIDWQNCCAKSN